MIILLGIFNSIFRSEIFGISAYLIIFYFLTNSSMNNKFVIILSLAIANFIADTLWIPYNLSVNKFL